MKETSKPKYSTWIRKRRIVLFWAFSVLLFFLGIVLGLTYRPLMFISFLAAPFAYIAFIISLTAFRFGSRGGDFQNRIHARLIESLAPKGSVLDIGCGSGNLIIKISKISKATNCGLDFWGTDWEYSKSQCETNAKLEAVENVTFIQGSASKLPVESDHFENVVSCLTFHEVRDVDDKTKSIAEAMRVLRPKGRFVFFDLFNDTAFYRSLDDVKRAIELGGGKIELINPYNQIEKLPFPLNTPKVLKHAVLIVGMKS